MTKILSFLFSFGVFYAAYCPSSRADEFYTAVIKKQEEKKKTRWSLSEWLETRDRIRLMDLWLALHSPSPYEFFSSVYFISASRMPGDVSAQGLGVSFAAFATVFGLEISAESVYQTPWHLIFDLRILGVHDQSTQITLQGGAKFQRSQGRIERNSFAGARLSIYITRFFGLEGLFRYYFASNLADEAPQSSQQNSVDTELAHAFFELGAFVDYHILRVFGTFRKENLIMSISNINLQNSILFGLKFYF